MSDYSVVQGDTHADTAMPITLTDNGTAATIAVSDTVELVWTKPDGTTSTVSLTDVDRDAAEFKRVWVAGDTDQVGLHTAQVLVTDSGGKERTFPNDGTFILWNVYRRLGV